MANPEIKAALIELLDAIRRSDGPVVSREMERLESLAQISGPALHPQLRHFLERRSYAKALAFVEQEGVA